MARRIDLLIPGLFWNSAIRSLKDREYRPKNLERILSRSTLIQHSARDLTETLFHLFGLEADEGCDLPAGAVIGQGGDLHLEGRYWASVNPVHLLTDRDRLILIRLTPQSITREYAAQLIKQFNTHFKAEGVTLSQITPDQWCMGLSSLPDITTSNLDSVAGRHIEPYLPVGSGAAAWRKLLNETQMLFFQDELSQQKMVAGEAPINAIWVSGIGVCPRVESDYAALFGSHPLISGFAKLGEISNHALPEDLSEILNQEGNIAILIPDLLDAELDADLSAWENALATWDRRLVALFKGLDISQDRLTIYTCQGQKYSRKRRFSFIDLFTRDRRIEQFV